MTHWKALTNPDYLGAYSLEDGKDIILTIDTVRQETITGTDGKRETVTVCRWQEDEKPMILNVTNAKTITKLLKTPYIEQWQGKRIQIGVETVRAFGDVVDALRVRSFLPVASSVKCAVCGKDITPAHSMTGDQLAEYTRKKYGKPLCAACATKEART